MESLLDDLKKLKNINRLSLSRLDVSNYIKLINLNLRKVLKEIKNCVSASIGHKKQCENLLIQYKHLKSEFLKTFYSIPTTSTGGGLSSRKKQQTSKDPDGNKRVKWIDVSKKKKKNCYKFEKYHFV